MPRSIVFLRHGHNHGDSLSAIGTSQALVLAAGYIQHHVRFDVVFASPAERAAKTAQYVAQKEGTHGIILLRALFPLEQDPRTKIIVNAVNGSELFWNTPLNKLEDEARTALEDLANEASESIAREIQRTSAEHTLVVGHRLFLEALLRYMAPKKNKELFESLVLDNCAGAVFELDESLEVVGITLIIQPVVTA